MDCILPHNLHHVWHKNDLYIVTTFLLIAPALPLLSGTRLYTMSADHGNDIQTSSTHPPCYWLQIMMTELSRYTPWSFWRLVSDLNCSYKTTESFSCFAVSFLTYMLCLTRLDYHLVMIHGLFLFQTLQHVLITSLEKSPQTNPIIGRIECKAGHGAGRPTQKMVNTCLD